MHIQAIMKLNDWLKSNGKTDAWLAAQVGKDRSVISKIRVGTVTPSLRTAVAIQIATDGDVKPADLLPAKQPAEATP
jgi:DNA-binding transcriptional regulator YdaS (Cro superfamily)